MTEIKCPRCGSFVTYPASGKKNEFGCGYCKFEWETIKERKKK
jgi:ribosomal protein S27E